MSVEVLNIFQQDAFSAMTLTMGVQRNPFQPVGLGAMNIFEPDPIRTTAVSVEERTGVLKLIPLSARGAEGTQRTTEKRKMRYFEVPRLMHDDTVYASEVQNIREFQEGQQTVTVLMQLQNEVARRVNGPTGLLANVEYTKEYMRLAALQGKMVDPKDGSTLYDWFDEFEITQSSEVAFNLDAQAENTIRTICNGVTRTMARKAQGAFTQSTRVVGLCGDGFYDKFVNHKDVIRTFLNFQDARDVRDGGQGAAFGAFNFSGIDWVNYRGSDDNTSLKIPDNEVKFFPVGAPGIFREVNAPGETWEWVNTPGKPVYLLPVPDTQRRMWWKVEAYAYPLFMCTRPEVLLRGRAGA